jgi:hypothetical protein
MFLYLPVALTSINVLIPVGLGLAVGLLSGLFGVGGGFLMTPLLILFGIPATVAAATDSNQIVAASTSGTYAHWRLGNVDFKMGWHLLIGGFVGGLLGVQGIKSSRAGNADRHQDDLRADARHRRELYVLRGLTSLRKKSAVAALPKETAFTRFLARCRCRRVSRSPASRTLRCCP